MNKIFLFILAGLFLLGVLFRVFFSLLFPKKFSEGARYALFVDERCKKIFPVHDGSSGDEEDQTEEGRDRNNNDPGEEERE